MRLSDQKIKEILIAESYVSSDDMAQAEAKAKEGHISLVDVLISDDEISEELLGQAMAEYYHTSFFNLDKKQIHLHGFGVDAFVISEDLARKYGLVLIENEERVVVATYDPANDEAKQALSELFRGKEVEMVYSLPDQIESYVNNFYKKELDTRFKEIVNESEIPAPDLINEIFRDAIKFKASDIHLEPYDEKVVVVRFRVDGVLHEAGRLSKEVYDIVLNLIKVEARLPIDEHSSPLDGAIRYSGDWGEVDVRVAIAPKYDGEKVVMRLLVKHAGGLKLNELGLSADNQSILNKAIAKPFGMVLITGPTGSGKTTTLYSIIKKINTPEKNITTIEDPVEYKISGINQMQVNPRADLSFAKGLKSLVREDPDVILVGEIRDTETAEISVNAALTGHLLFSTFHANNAASAVPRLIDMGIEPYLLASTLELIMAQRLVRKLCMSCRHSHAIGEEEKSKLSEQALKTLHEVGSIYKSEGCNSCNFTGYKGRIALFELISVSDELQELISKNIGRAKDIHDLARKQGAKSLFEDGMEKVKLGQTTIDEVLRVTPQEE